MEITGIKMNELLRRSKRHLEEIKKHFDENVPLAKIKQYLNPEPDLFLGETEPDEKSKHKQHCKMLREGSSEIIKYKQALKKCRQRVSMLEREIDISSQYLQRLEASREIEYLENKIKNTTDLDARKHFMEKLEAKRKEQRIHRENIEKANLCKEEYLQYILKLEERIKFYNKEIEKFHKKAKSEYVEWNREDKITKDQMREFDYKLSQLVIPKANKFVNQQFKKIIDMLPPKLQGSLIVNLMAGIFTTFFSSIISKIGISETIMQKEKEEASKNETPTAELRRRGTIIRSPEQGQDHEPYMEAGQEESKKHKDKP